MADGLNQVTLIGNLGADPELRSTSNGTSVLKLRLATTESYIDGEGNRQSKTEWHSVTVWGKRAEGLSSILRVGNRVAIVGSLRTNSWETEEGEKKYRTEVHALNVVLCGGSGAGKRRNNREEEQPYNDDEEDEEEDNGQPESDGLPAFPPKGKKTQKQPTRLPKPTPSKKQPAKR